MKLRKLFCFICILFFVFSFCGSSFAVSNSSPNVNAPVALLMDNNTGKIVYEKDAYKRMFPASTTKIMTAILALENCDLSDVATVSYDAIFTVPSGYSTASLQVGENLTIEQLLYVLLIPSANDAANVIAEHVAGSVSSFASMMNTKAHELGCKDTNFVNPNGVHAEDHYSTAYDLALIGRYAMKNDIFRKFVSSYKYSLPITNKYDKDDRSFNNTNKLLNPKGSQYYSYTTGIKTGYTDAAKNCIVASAKKDDLELICVILGAGNDTPTNTNKFSDCKTLFEYGFKNYTNKLICAKDTVYKVVSPGNASQQTSSLNVLYENDINVFINNSDINKDFSPELDFNEKKLKAPIAKGTVVGKISYTIDGINYTTNLIAGQDIEENSVLIIIAKIVGIILVLLIFMKILHIFRGNSGKRSYSRKRKTKNSKYVSFYKFDY